MESGDKRAAIIHAALELVSECGFHGAPMALVAKRAGVAAGTIYHYFESKDILITEIYADLEERLLAGVMENYPEKGTVQERFVHVAKTLVHQWISAPLDFRFMEQFHNSPYGVALRRDMVLRKHDKYVLLKTLEEGREAHLVKDLPLPILLSLSIGPLLNICRDHILGFFQLDEPLLDQVVDGCWSAVKR